MTPRAHDIYETLLQMASPERAQVLLRFFKTGKGQYGEGDKFLGVDNPHVRMVVKMAWKDTTLEDARCLATNEWHEVRLSGLLILVEQFLFAHRKKDQDRMEQIFRTYISLHPHINNWDLVDLSAYKIVGNYEILHPEETLMDQWIQPDHTLWQQRISMIATWMHVRHHHFGQLLSRAEVLIPTQENLLQKASGWMLREMGKHSEEGKEHLLLFLEQHVHEMPSVMLSYAIEQFPSDQRLYWREESRRRRL